MPEPRAVRPWRPLATEWVLVLGPSGSPQELSYAVRRGTGPKCMATSSDDCRVLDSSECRHTALKDG
jgi:hypothetical protein